MSEHINSLIYIMTSIRKRPPMFQKIFLRKANFHFNDVAYTLSSFDMWSDAPHFLVLILRRRKRNIQEEKALERSTSSS